MAGWISDEWSRKNEMFVMYSVDSEYRLILSVSSFSVQGLNDERYCFLINGNMMSVVANN